MKFRIFLILIQPVPISRLLPPYLTASFSRTLSRGVRRPAYFSVSWLHLSLYSVMCVWFSLYVLRNILLPLEVSRVHSTAHARNFISRTKSPNWSLTFTVSFLFRKERRIHWCTTNSTPCLSVRFCWIRHKATVIPEQSFQRVLLLHNHTRFALN